MKPEHKALRDRMRAIPTHDELQRELSRYTLSDAERAVATLSFGHRRSRAAIAEETGYSVHTVRRLMEGVYNRLSCDVQ